MRILYLAHRVPFPPNKGDKIRSYHELRYLSERHEIHLIAFCDEPEDLAYLAELRKSCRSAELIPLDRRVQRLRALRSMLHGRPWSLGYFDHPGMHSAIRTRAGSLAFDFLFVYSSPMAQYAESLSKTPRALDFVDSDASKWLQYAQVKPAPMNWLYRYEAKRLAEFERRMVREFGASIFVSPRETLHLSDNSGNPGIHFAQNGVDLDYFTPVPGTRPSQSIVFTGAMDYFPNVDAVLYFVREVFPKVRSRIPDAEFLIVGRQPAPRVLHLSRTPGVRVTGSVRDVRPYLATARVAVAPIRVSQGVQNKILEALAAGLPVVATTAAAAGLGETEGLSLSIADDPVSFAGQVIEFLETPLAADQVHVCRESLARHYDWTSNLSVLDGILKAGMQNYRSYHANSSKTAADDHE